jgi:hypothetical protein
MSDDEVDFNFDGNPDRVASMADDLEEMINSQESLLEDEADDLEYEEYEEVEDVEEEEAEEPPSFYRLGDYEIPAEQVDDVVNLLQWASSLSPEQAARVNEALAGNYETDSRPEPQPEPAKAEPDYPSFISDLDNTDPTMARYMREMYDERVTRERELEDRIAELTKEFVALEGVTGQQIASSTREKVEQVEAEVRDKFLAEHGLDDADYGMLVNTAAELDITNQYVDKYGLEEGFYKALETAYYANPQVREMVINGEIEAAVTSERTASRKEAASGLAPQGGTNLPASSPAGLPQSERRSAMVRDIEALLGMQP